MNRNFLEICTPFKNPENPTALAGKLKQFWECFFSGTGHQV